jgi:uncharacterized membrane protein
VVKLLTIARHGPLVQHTIQMAWLLALLVPALLVLMALLLTTNPVHWFAMVHLLDRLAATVSGGLLLGALIVSHAATATPVIVSSNARSLANKARITVVMPPRAVTKRFSARMWSTGLFATVAWLLAATLHLVLHQLLEPAEGCSSQALVSRLFCALSKEREQQLLALQVGLLAVLAVYTMLEVAGSGRSAPRIHTVGLTFAALIPGAVAEMDPPISAGGLLISAHVIGAVCWAGGLLGILNLARLCSKQKNEVHASFIYVVAARYSEIAFAASFVVLLSGAALALSGPEISLARFTSTPAGLVSLGKFVLALLLVGAGLLQRLYGLPRMLLRTSTNPTWILCLLGIIELIVMAACYAGGIALSERIFKP